MKSRDTGVPATTNGATARGHWPLDLGGIPEHRRAGKDHATVLVVDDDDFLRRLMSRVLTASGYRVRQARNGLEALAIFDRHDAVDLVVSDVMMPGMSGLELAIRLARHRLPILMISGYSGSAITTPRGSTGDLSYLSKPFTPRQLLRQVRALLG